MLFLSLFLWLFLMLFLWLFFLWCFLLFNIWFSDYRSNSRSIFKRKLFHRLYVNSMILSYSDIHKLWISCGSILIPLFFKDIIHFSFIWLKIIIIIWIAMSIEFPLCITILMLLFSWKSASFFSWKSSSWWSCIFFVVLASSSRFIFCDSSFKLCWTFVTVTFYMLIYSRWTCKFWSYFWKLDWSIILFICCRCFIQLFYYLILGRLTSWLIIIIIRSHNLRSLRHNLRSRWHNFWCRGHNLRTRRKICSHRNTSWHWNIRLLTRLQILLVWVLSTNSCLRILLIRVISRRIILLHLLWRIILVIDIVSLTWLIVICLIWLHRHIS